MEMNYETRTVVAQMFRQDEVTIHKSQMFIQDEVVTTHRVVDMQRVAEALMAENVRVKKLHLWDIFAIEDAEAIRDALQVNQTVKELCLWCISADCFVAIAAGMAVTQNINSLFLRNLLHCDDELTSFNAALRTIMTFVEELTFDCFDLVGVGARVLADSLRNSSCRILRLHNCCMGSEGVAHLGETLGTITTLRMLDLSENRLGNAGAVAWARELMGNQNIRVLQLQECDMVGSEGAAAVGRLLESNTTIEEINISLNNFGDEGCSVIVDGLSRNQGLRNLNLGCSNVGNDGAKRIGRTLKSNSHLERLDLHLNRITDEGFEALVDGLSCNTTLLEMNLTDNDHIPAFLACRIDNYLEANRLLHRYRSREPASISPFLLSLILDRVSFHPSVLYFVVRDHIPDLLA
jgi:hypothetical protein